MKKFLTIDGESDGALATGKFIFNSQKGTAIGVFSLETQSDVMINSAYIDQAYLEGDALLVGDMLRSNFITITDRNYPNNNNQLKTILYEKSIFDGSSERICSCCKCCILGIFC